MTISIPKATAYRSLETRRKANEGLRVITLNAWKAENPGVSLSDQYDELFGNGWKEHDIHKLSYEDFQKEIQELGYTIDELIEIGEKYAAEKNAKYNNSNGSKKSVARTDYVDNNEYPPY